MKRPSRKIEAIEYPFAVPLSDPNTGETLDVSLVGVVDLIESDEEGNLIIAELKTSSKRYADSQGENQLDGLIYAYAIDQLGFRTTNAETLIRYDVLVKTKSPAFQQIYFNKSGKTTDVSLDGSKRSFRRSTTKASFPTLAGPATTASFVHCAGACDRRQPAFLNPRNQHSEFLRSSARGGRSSLNGKGRGSQLLRAWRRRRVFARRASLQDC